MFDKLVESSGKQRLSKLRRRMLATCSLAVISLAGMALLASMFSAALAMGDQGWDVERLVFPALNPDPEQASTNVNKSHPASGTRENVTAVRREHVARLEEPVAKIPKGISTVPNALRERPLGAYTQGDTDTDPSNPGFRRETERSEIGFGGGSDQKVGPQNKPNEPVPVAPPPKLKSSGEKPDYIGIVNGKALDLVIPIYPSSARQLGIRGQVKIQVLIDEDGNVKSASFVEGPVMLRSAALDAARASRFSPTTLNGRKVPVRGLIVYNFR